VARIGGKGNAYRVVVGKSKLKIALVGGENGSKVDVKN
jgi:hypothetical protein